MSWAAVVADRQQPTSFAAIIAKPASVGGRCGANTWFYTPTSPFLHVATATTSPWGNASIPAVSTVQNCHLSGHSQQLNMLGGSSSQTPSSNSNHPLHGTSPINAAASELRPTKSSSTAQGTRPVDSLGKKRRCQTPGQLALAKSVQASFAEGQHKYHESPQRVCMKHRQTMALQRGTVQSKMIIGAAMVGKCAGFSPYPDAQTEMLEVLLQQQNPLKYAQAVQGHSYLSELQQAQQVISQKAPQLQPYFDRAEQLGSFEDHADSWQKRNAAADDMEAALAQFQAKQEAAAAVKQEAAASKQEAATAATREAALAQLQRQKEAAAVAKQTARKLADAACQEDQLCTASAAVAAAAAEHYVLAELLLEFETAPTAAQSGAVAPSLPDVVVSNSIQADSAMTEIITVDCSDSASDTATYVSEPAWSAIGGPLSISETSDSNLSGFSSSAFSDQHVALTQQDIQLICKVNRQRCNTAFGMHAERPTARELDLGAKHQSHSWHKMGAPDNLPLGSCNGIAFELGCQIDRAHVQGSNVIPAEFKNRVSRFMSQGDNCPHSLPAHELVQVHCQLQLSGAPHGLLIERLDRGYGQVQTREHVVLRDDWWWEHHLMPALHAFLRVFAKLTSQENYLTEYLMARQHGRHQHYLRQLICEEWQQPMFGV